MISVREYAMKNHKDPGNVRRMISTGRLPAVRIGNQWAIDETTPYPADKRVHSGLYRNWRKRIGYLSDPGLFGSISRMIGELQTIYGSHLRRIVLYGSYARKEQTEESDIDIALILSPGYTKKMNQQMYRCVSEKELETGKTLSVNDIDEEHFLQWKSVLPFYRNLDMEGVELWTQV